MIVIKRKKFAQEFDENKMCRSIERAFATCQTACGTEDMKRILKEVHPRDGMRTEDLQKEIEVALMKTGFYNEARFFIIWRHLNYYQRTLANKSQFMREYLMAANAATGSKYDANSNVTEKNVATLTGELPKGDFIRLNRYRLYNKIEEMYGKGLADEYLRQLESHEIYKHDETSIMPYCVAISMYPYMLNGLKDLGGLSAKPCNLDSYCGTFINLIFAIASQFAGAVASAEFLMYFDYFARKEFSENYTEISNEFCFIGPELRKLLNSTGKWFKDINSLRIYNFQDAELNALRDKLVYDSERPLTQDELKVWYEQFKAGDTSMSVKLGDGSRTIKSFITQKFQQIVYSLNQPAASRNYQSTFWNISYFDRYYFEGIFGEFKFPDGTAPVWNTTSWLQKTFMRWFNKERLKCVLTFPVETMALLTEGNDIKDKEYADFTAEMYAEGASFFTYTSDNPDSLSSCCRLRNEMQDNTFSYTLGAGGVSTGSKSVMTINLNRLVQNAVRNKKNYVDCVREQVLKCHKYQLAFNELLLEFEKAGALPVYNAGFISMKKQYLTLGINGLVEAAEFLGIEAKPTKKYHDFVESILKVFYEENKKARTKNVMFNTEYVPAENLGAKNRKWDEEDGYAVPKRVCYNSYFYASEDTTLSLIDKFKLHGKDFVQYLDGGSALHMNLDEHLDFEQYRQCLRIAAHYGTNYFTFNIPNTICNECGNIDKRHLESCPKCGSTDIDYLTRVIGYLKRITNFPKIRQIEAGMRYYLKKDKVSV